MVRVGRTPFVQIQMEYFAALGFRRFILAVGYLWQQIRDYFGDGSHFGWEIEYSVESAPLGTGGATLLARDFWASTALVANGDTFLPGNWTEMLDHHSRTDLPATMAVVRQEDCSRFGTVEIADNKIVGFREKQADTGPGWINGGVYILQSRALDGFSPGRKFSLENDVFPSLTHSILAYRTQEQFADIGTPESLEEFRSQYQVP